MTGEFGSIHWKNTIRFAEPIEVLVSKRTFRKAVEAIRRKYPALQMCTLLRTNWFNDMENQRTLIQLTQPVGRLLQMYFRNSICSSIGCRVPTIEMAFVERFAGIIELDPDASRCRNDIADFAEILRRKGRVLNWRKVRTLANRLMIEGGKYIRECAKNVIAERVESDLMSN